MILIKKLLLIPLLLLGAIAVNAQSFGSFASAVFVKKNGTFSIYNVTGSGVNMIGPGGPSYTGSLGTYDQNSGKLMLEGAEVKTYKDPGTNVCGAYYNYSIHPVGQTAPYTEMNLPIKATCSNGTFTDGLGPCSGSDQKWNKENAEIDLTNRCPGTYVMDVYYRIPGSSSSPTACNENVYIGSPTSPSGSMTFTIVGTPLTTVINTPSPVCEGSSLNLATSTTGGSSPYTYLWMGPNAFTSTASSATVTAPGTYTLTTTDQCGTATTTQTTVTFKPKPAAPSVSSTATVCPAGTATLTASGCNGDVTWSNGATGSSTNAPAGTYTATCTVDGCTSSSSTSVTVQPCSTTPPPACLPPAIVTGPTSCTTGTAVLTATGCNGTVTWSTGATGSSIAVYPGTYTATCTSNGCTSAPSSPVTVQPCATPPTCNAPTVSKGPTACPSNLAIIVASGCSGIVTWSNGATGSTITVSPGSYTATCTINGVPSIPSTPIVVPACPSAPPPPPPTTCAPPTVIAGPTSCASGVAVLTASGCNGTVTWSNGATGTSICAYPGTYTATCTSNGCTSAPSTPVTVMPCIPPPAPPVIVVGTVSCPAGTTTLTATGCNGTVTWSNGMTGSTITVPPGNYTATCTTSGGTSVPSNPVTAMPCSVAPPCPPAPAPPLPPPPCPTTNNLVVNGSFESKVVTYSYTPVIQPGWVNEAPGNDGQIETWRSGTEGASAPAGNQFIEVNDKTLGILTQTIAVKPGAQINFSYYHRSRKSSGGEKLRMDFKDIASGKIIHSFESTSTNTWKKFKTTFQAAGSSIQLRVVSLNTCTSLTDAGCGNLLDAVTMNYAGCECTFVPDPPAICATTDNLCTNGSTTITATGCPGGTIRWSNGQTGPVLTTNVPGVYTAQCIMPNTPCESVPSNPIEVKGCTDVGVSCPTFEWHSNGVYHIKSCVTNYGSTPASGSISFTVNGQVVYTDNYSNLAPGASVCFVYRTRFIPCGTNVCATVSTTVIGTDYNPGNNTCSGCQPMTCVSDPPPYDPNYKDPSPKRSLEGGIFESDEWLTYTVHCQNDGLGIAHNVIMIDTIDVSKFDINSLQVLGSKDPVQFRKVNDTVVAFDFIGVGLTSSFNDLPRSQTEVIFKIKRLPGQPIGTELTNKVGIYFDHEKVVETDLAFSKIIAPCDPSVTKTGMVLSDQYVPKGSTPENPFTLKDYDGVITGWEMSTDPAFNSNVSKVDNYTQVLNYNEAVNNATYFRALVQTGGCPSAPSQKAAIYPICSGNLVKNGSFEDPALTGKTWAMKAVQGWTNTADNNTLEIQRNLNVTAADGAQYVELNGNSYGNIYQDISVDAGKLIRWNVDHRARSAANEVIKVTLSAPDGSNAQTVSHRGLLTEWQPVTGVYQTAAEQTVVRMRIVSSGGSAASGNYIDNVVLDYDGCNNPAFAKENTATLPGITNDGIYTATVQPNPAKVSAEISLSGFEGGAVQLNVIDPQGRVLKSIRYDYAYGGKIPLDLSDLSSGLYLIRVQQETKIATTKVVKN